VAHMEYTRGAYTDLVGRPEVKETTSKTQA